MNPQTKNIFSRLILITTLLIFSVSAMGQRTQTAKSAKRGAGWGALAGLVFGGSVWDVASGAAVGAAGGAAYGALKSNEQQKRMQTDIAYEESQQRIRIEQERNYILAEQKRAELAGQAVADKTNWMADRDLLNRAFGEDNVDGLFELRACQYDKALLHAYAGANSDMLSHRLSSIWLEAMIAQDRKDTASAKRAYQRIVAQDDTVSSLDEAKEETIDALVDVRADRKNEGIQCKA